jgi:hypothetical protein
VALCTLPPDRRTDARADPDGPPTEVAIMVHVLDVPGIDDADQRIDIDTAIVMS